MRPEADCTSSRSKNARMKRERPLQVAEGCAGRPPAPRPGGTSASGSRRCRCGTPGRGDDPDGRLARQHGADLHRGVWVRSSRGAVLALPPRRRCRASPAPDDPGEVERLEVVVVVLDLRPLGDAETHLGEDRSDLLRGQVHRVDAAHAPRPGRVTSSRSASSRASSARSARISPARPTGPPRPPA